MIKGSIQQEDVTLINIFASNIRAPKYIKQILRDLKGAIESKTIIIEEFNTYITVMDGSYRQKMNKGSSALNNTIDQLT